MRTKSNEQLEKFIKLNENSKLYNAKHKISAITKIKPNAWERDYGTNHLKLQSLARKSWAHSRIRGFNWLLASHALPVATQMKGGKTAATYASAAAKLMKQSDTWHMVANGPRMSATLSSLNGGAGQETPCQ